MKIGILTFSWSRNFGAALQTFALKTYLDKLGCETYIIDYHPIRKKPNQTVVNKIKSILLYILLIPDRKRLHGQIEKFNQFSDMYFNKTQLCLNAEMIETLRFDVVFYGSDQIWNYKLTGGRLDPVYFADFKKAIAPRNIAYAASIGERDFQEEDKKTVQKFLKNFDLISVREQQIVETVQRLTKLTVKNVLDPTLLLEKKDYEKIRSNINKRTPYVLIYQNTRNNEIYEIAKYIAAKNKWAILEIGYRKQVPNPGVPMIFDLGPSDFLSYYSQAEFVVTNTFHGTVFAIQFEKQFISIPLKGRESRVENLGIKLGIENRLVYGFKKEEVDKICDFPIDYSKVQKKLKIEQDLSYQYIDNALGGENDTRK